MLTESEIKEIFARRSAIITGSHFVYAKKPDGYYHGTEYVNKDAIYPFVDDVSNLCHEFARRAFFQFGAGGIDVVVGPTVGAVSLAQWTAYWLNRIEGTNRVLAVCADEEDVLESMEVDAATIYQLAGERVGFSATGRVEIFFNAKGELERVAYQTKVATRRIIKRGYDAHVEGKRCLIVEDVINSGLTLAKVRHAILSASGTPIGACCLCNRSGEKVTAQTLLLPWLTSLLDVDMKMFKEEDCPICLKKGKDSVRLDLGKGKDFLIRTGIKP